MLILRRLQEVYHAKERSSLHFVVFVNVFDRVSRNVFELYCIALICIHFTCTGVTWLDVTSIDVTCTGFIWINITTSCCDFSYIVCDMFICFANCIGLYCSSRYFYSFHYSIVIMTSNQFSSVILGFTWRLNILCIVSPTDMKMLQLVC